MGNITEVKQPIHFKPPHQGCNVQRFRGLLRMNQDVLAEKLGISKTTLSGIENQSIIDEKYLQALADALNVTVEDIKYYNPDSSALKIIHNYDGGKVYDSSKVQDNESGDNIDNIDTYINNPIDKVGELYERIITLTAENTELKAQVTKK